MGTVTNQVRGLLASGATEASASRTQPRKLDTFIQILIASGA
jgi:hypothetical protein